MNETSWWIGFIVFILIMLFLDLKVFHRKAERISVRSALLWSAFWIGLSILFGILVYFTFGHDLGLQFFTGYLVEKSLSVDNLFVFLMLFTYFCVPDKYEHEVLFWGVLGAIVMRAVFIFAGISLLHALSWTIYIFGAFLLFTGVRMLFEKGENKEPKDNAIVKLTRRFLPVANEYDGGKFFTVKNGRRLATPLLLVLISIETTDILFAMDSVPAVLSVSTDPFIVFSSNILAILGLRSLYFALEGVLEKLEYLHYGLSAILVFLGVKMIIGHWVEIHILLSLGIIGAILAVAIVASLLGSRRRKMPAPQCLVKPEEPSEAN